MGLYLGKDPKRNFMSVRLAACFAMGRASEFKLNIEGKGVSERLDWESIHRFSTFKASGILRGGAPRRLEITPLMAQFIVFLRALLSQSGDPMITMGLAEMYSSQQHSQLLEEIQHHLIDSVTTVTQLWDALSVHARDDQPSDMKNLAIIVWGLLRDSNRLRVRNHVSMIISKDMIPRMCMVSSDTEEIMVNVWVFMLAAT